MLTSRPNSALLPLPRPESNDNQVTARVTTHRGIVAWWLPLVCFPLGDGDGTRRFL